MTLMASYSTCTLLATEARDHFAEDPKDPKGPKGPGLAWNWFGGSVALAKGWFKAGLQGLGLE